MKYVDSMVTFSEVPDEITLAISISGCNIHCPDCHSKYLWEDTGKILDWESLHQLIEANKGITCVCFMGGTPKEILDKVYWIKTRHPELHTAWYTGLPTLKDCVEVIKYLDYCKVGPYIKEKGPLTSPTTNQRFYARGAMLHKISAYPETFYDITDRFWKKDDNRQLQSNQESS